MFLLRKTSSCLQEHVAFPALEEGAAGQQADEVQFAPCVFTVKVSQTSVEMKRSELVDLTLSPCNCLEHRIGSKTLPLSGL
mmetsp:Transcript_59471/g.114795  ORF Transcript_59471/g.114795 Transcript_59471/m.114795 type:complete len:81 (+) Transcript_59471:2468-2710(+)